ESSGQRSLADCDYGLLAPFLDGMVRGAARGVRLVDGYELSYGYRTASQFAAARQTVKHDLLPIVGDPDKFQRLFSLGFGLWLDYDWRKRGWNTQDPDRNYFSPASFQTSVSEALRATDEYVWIYTETPRWWSEQGQPLQLPVGYEKA